MSARGWEPRPRPSQVVDWPEDRCLHCRRSLYLGDRDHAGKLFCRGCDERPLQCYCPRVPSPLADNPA